MIFLESFKITALGMVQIFLLGAIGYFMVKKNIISRQGLDSLSQLVVIIVLPVFIFCQLLKGFSFTLYPDWWIFPLTSIAVTFAGFLIGSIFAAFIKGSQYKSQFLSLITFQNAGYLPLALVAALLPPAKTDTMFIYIFLFLLGFNLVVWSLGKYMISFSGTKRFELGSLFSPPVIAILISLTFIFLGLNKFMPQGVLKPLRMLGDCTLPLALFVVGGNLASIHLGRIDKKAIVYMVLAKLIILPILGLWLAVKLGFSELIGLLIIIQLAMPPATSLSLIVGHYKKEDLLISQGIFVGHIMSLITIPIFLSLYFTLTAIR